jgi:putative transposase
MKNYTTSAHAKWKLRYHIIFSTKYRKKCLEPIRTEVLAAFSAAEAQSHFKILIMEIDRDHIHLLVKFSPAYSIEQVVRRLKQLTTKHIWDNCDVHMKQYYWGKKKRLWAGGYFVSSIGDVSEKTVMEYIKNQG